MRVRLVEHVEAGNFGGHKWRLSPHVINPGLRQSGGKQRHQRTIFHQSPGNVRFVRDEDYAELRSLSFDGVPQLYSRWRRSMPRPCGGAPTSPAPQAPGGWPRRWRGFPEPRICSGRYGELRPQGYKHNSDGLTRCKHFAACGRERDSFGGRAIRLRALNRVSNSRTPRPPACWQHHGWSSAPERLP
jgi:hypothetical protein